MAKRHTMTPARRAALRKAQIASARKRKGRGRSRGAAMLRKGSKTRRVGRKVAKRAAITTGVGAGAVFGAALYAASGIAPANSGKNRRQMYGPKKADKHGNLRPRFGNKRKKH